MFVTFAPLMICYVMVKCLFQATVHGEPVHAGGVREGVEGEPPPLHGKRGAAVEAEAGGALHRLRLLLRG